MIVKSNVKPIVVKTMLVACVLVFFCAFLLAAPAKETTPVAFSLMVPRPANSQGNSDQSGDEWPMFHGALNHTGTVVTTSPANDTGSSWNYATGSYVDSSPAVTGGRVYVGSYDGNVYCLNATTGASIWNNGLYSSVDSSPVIAGGRVYVGDCYGIEWCLNATTGEFIWSYTTDVWEDVSSAAVAGDRVYVGSNNHKIYCLNATTGAFIWSYTTGDGVYSSPAVAGGRVYVGGYDHKVYCLNATIGTSIWNYTTGNYVTSSPAITSGRVYVGSCDDKVYCLDATTGAFIWSYSTGNNVQSSPAVAGGRVYVGSYDHKVYCLNATTGTHVWDYTTGGYVDSSPAVAGGRVYVGSWDNKTYCLNATTGVLVTSFTAGDRVHSSPAVTGERVYVGSSDGYLYCFPIKEAAPRNLHVISDNAQSVLTWQIPLTNVVFPVTGYRIYRDFFPGSETYYMTIGNATWYSDLNVTIGDTYYYHVSAITNTGEGFKSTEAYVTIVAGTPGTPGVPQNLEATDNSDQIVLLWQIPVNNGGSAIIGYKIYRGTDPSNLSFLTIIDNITTYVDTNTNWGELYYYKISAGNNFGEGMQSTEVSIRRYIWLPPLIPQDVYAIGGNTQITLTWQPPIEYNFAPVTNYTIYRGTNSGSVSFYKTVGNVTMFVDTGLTGGQSYYYIVSAVNLAGGGYPSGEVSVVPFSVPSLPRDVQAICGHGQITLSWLPPANNGGTSITNYRIYRGTESFCETFLVMTGDGTIYNDSSVVYGQIYYYVISAVNDAGEGAPSEEDPGIRYAVPTMPQNMQATTMNGVDGQITLTWEAPVDEGGAPVTNYMIYRGISSGSETFLAMTGDGTRYIDASVVYGQIYYYIISAVSDIGEGAPSTEASATAPTVPGNPRNLVATAGIGSINLTWQVPLSNGGSAITDYGIYRSNGGGSWDWHITIGNMTTFTDTGLMNGHEYWYGVSAINGVGSEPSPSAQTFATTPNVPAVPRNLVAAAGIGNIMLTWQVPSSNGGSAITGYKIYRGASSSTELYHVTVSNITTFNDTSLMNGQSCFYNVSAINGAGEGPRTTETSATTTNVPGVPRNLLATAGIGNIVLTWQVPSSNGGSAITGYKIYRGASSGNELYFITIGNVTIFTDTGLMNGQSCFYNVTASNAAGEGPRTTEASAMTPNVPGVPRNLVATAGIGSIVLTWQVPASNGGLAMTGYKIYRGVSSGNEIYYITTSNVTTFTDTGLMNGQTCFYNVSAINGASEGPRTTEASATTPNVPGVPRNLVATAGTGTITLTWDVPISNGGVATTGYSIYRGTTTGGETYLVSVGNVTTFTDANVESDQPYYYLIRAKNGAGESIQSPEVNASPSSPSTPSGNPQGVPSGLTLYELVFIVGVTIFGVVALGFALILHQRDKKHIARLSSDIQRITGKPPAKKGTSRYTSEPEQKDDLPATRGSPNLEDDDEMKPGST